MLSTEKNFLHFAILCAFLFAGCSSIHHGSENISSEIKVNDSQKTENYIKSDIRKLIASEEKANGIPNGILDSIAAVESQHSAYVVNARKKSHKFKTKAEAVRFINDTVKHGGKNISIGCLQLHYATHKKNFSSVEDMVSPRRNVAYAATLLRKLYNRYGSWELAIKKFHSSKRKYNNLYYRKVMKVYNTSKRFTRNQLT